MKASGLNVRVIVPLALICFLAGFGGRLAQAQGIPTSGAMVTINGTVNGAPVKIVIYDSQIHSGNVQAVPVGGGSSCSSTDAKYPTDAFVLQGGSWTGCDTGDAFEVTDGNTSGSAHQSPGVANVSGFHIETHYVCGGACSGFPETLPGPICNTSGTICANPDSGMLIVTNNTNSNFLGTITLQGNSALNSVTGAGYCAVNGAAFDSSSFTSETPFTAGSSVSLILGTEGTTENPGLADSSNCGGFNATQTSAVGGPFQFLVGSEIYTVTPFSGATGDKLSLLPIPVPAGPLGLYPWSPGNFGSETPAYPTAPFSATNYPGQAIIPYADFSAAGNPVGVEFQLSCSGTDCSTFLNTTQINFTVDPLSLPSGVGGVQFLAQHDGNPVGYSGTCPTNGFNVDIFFSYTPDPIKGKTDGNSCFVTTFNPNAAVVASGQTENQETFVGFQSPVINDGPVNVVQAGSAIPLIWKTFNSSQVPVTNLTLCNNPTGSGCSTTAPWVFIGTIAISCSTDQVLSGAMLLDTATSGGSGLQNMGYGTYQYNLKTVKGSTGCFTPVLGFSTGYWSFGVANFQYK